MRPMQHPVFGDSVNSMCRDCDKVKCGNCSVYHQCVGCNCQICSQCAGSHGGRCDRSHQQQQDTVEVTDGHLGSAVSGKRELEKKKLTGEQMQRIWRNREARRQSHKARARTAAAGTGRREKEVHV